MRYLTAVLLFIMMSNLALSQDLFQTSEDRIFPQKSLSEKQLIGGGMDFLKSKDELLLVSTYTSNTYFPKTFLINSEGASLSSSYMPSAYFRPNNNVLVVTGLSQKPKDSFNPYGATDITSVVFLSTVNSFISKIRISKR